MILYIYAFARYIERIEQLHQYLLSLFVIYVTSRQSIYQQSTEMYFFSE